MDARGILRLLEKTQGLAETAEQLGMRHAETIAREPRLSDEGKRTLTRLYAQHSQRLALLYCQLGLQACDALQSEAEDDAARGQIELFRASFSSVQERATALLQQTESHPRSESHSRTESHPRSE
jgi:hypothetical protein